MSFLVSIQKFFDQEERSQFSLNPTALQRQSSCVKDEGILDNNQRDPGSSSISDVKDEDTGQARNSSSQWSVHPTGAPEALNRSKNVKPCKLNFDQDGCFTNVYTPKSRGQQSSRATIGDAFANYSIPDKCSNLLSDLQSLTSLSNQTLTQINSKARTIQAFTKRLLQNLQHKENEAFDPMQVNPQAKRKMDQRRAVAREFKEKSILEVQQLHDQVLKALSGLQEYSTQCTINDDSMIQDQKDSCQIRQCHDLKAPNLYANANLGDLGTGYVPVRKFDDSATDILFFSQDDNQQYQHRLVTSFPRPVQTIFLHDTRLIVDTDVYIGDIQTGNFQRVGGVACKDMAEACALSSTQMLFSRMKYAKLVLLEWQEESQKYLILQRKCLSGQDHYCLRKLQPNLFAEGGTFEMYAANHKDSLKKFELDMTDIKRSRGQGVHRRKGLELIDYRQVTRNRMVVLYINQICIVNPLTQQELGEINLEVEQSRLIFAPGFDLEAFPMVITQGKVGLEVFKLEIQSPDDRKIRKPQMPDLIYESHDIVPIAEITRANREGEWDPSEMRAAKVDLLCHRNGSLCVIEIIKNM